MDIRTGLFYLFSTVLLFAAFRVITARNPVYAALFLVLAFFQAAAVWMLLKAEFLAITLVLVYVGAVMVLFLFVVMMLDINVARCARDSGSVSRWRSMVGAGDGGRDGDGGDGRLPSAEDAAGRCGARRRRAAVQHQGAGQAALHRVPVSRCEIAAVILLVAIIAAIALTLRARKDGSPHGARRSRCASSGADRVRLVKVAPTRGELPSAPPASAEARAEGQPCLEPVTLGHFLSAWAASCSRCRSSASS